MQENLQDLSIEFLRRMMRIRNFENRAEMLHAEGEIPGALHTTPGQEGAVVGACMALRTDDYMIGTHRSHGHPIAKGANLKGLMAELFAKKTGVCQGKGGSMHLSDFSVGSLGETSIVGSGLPVATGAALGTKLAGKDNVALCFFGDGASNEGTFHESLNLAAVWKLPVIFFCENNGYGATTPVSEAMAIEHVADRAAAYGMPGYIVDGQDIRVVYQAVKEAVARARRGAGPTLIEAKTYRYADHAVNMGRVLRDRGAELDQWLKRDPILLFEQVLLNEGVGNDVIAELHAEVEAEVEEAISFAKSSPYPDPLEAFDHTYIDRVPIPAGFKVGL